ncbi:hypothetical protein M9458_038993, partial [Cirrhinus mrigala]
WSCENHSILALKAAEDDSGMICFVFAVCFGVEDVPDGNYGPIRKLSQDSESSEFSSIISSRDVHSDPNAVLGCKYFSVTSTQRFVLF